MFPYKNDPDNEETSLRWQNILRWLANPRILLVVLATLMLISLFWPRSSPDVLNLPYSAFIAQVREGNVSRVEIDGQTINGWLREPITAPDQADVERRLPFLGQPRFRRFTTNFPQTGDERLLPLLEQQNVELNVRVQRPSILLGVLLTFGPVLLITAVFIYFLRQQTRGQQGLFNFGRTRAKAYTLDRPNVKFDDVAGADEAKRELVEVVDFLKHPDRYRKLGARIPRGALLIGPPGTGKTLLARAIAGEAGVPFFSASASEFVEMFVGVGASRVRDLFDQARRNAPAIVFIDELDAIGRQRGAGMGGGNDEREQTLNQILVELDGFDGNGSIIIIAATNRPDVLDPALLRPGRFDRQITVGLPDVRGREAVLKIHLRGKPIAPDVDPAIIARQTPGFAGADLANLVNEATLHAARRGEQQVAMRHFVEALDKIVLGLERPVLMSEHERRVIAYHEAGHALVAKLLPETDPVNKITIVARGRALGVTEYLPDGDRFSYSRQYLLSQLAVMLGGRAAEQVALGEITTGAENDLQRATDLARRMIGRWGMSEELGLLFVSNSTETPFLGREMAGPRDYSEATAALLDQAVRALLQERMQTAIRLLTEQRTVLDRVAQALLTHETLDRDGLEAVIRGDDIPPQTPPTEPTPHTPSASEQPVPQARPGMLPV